MFFVIVVVAVVVVVIVFFVLVLFTLIVVVGVSSSSFVRSAENVVFVCELQYTEINMNCKICVLVFSRFVRPSFLSFLHSFVIFIHSFITSIPLSLVPSSVLHSLHCLLSFVLSRLSPPFSHSLINCSFLYFSSSNVLLRRSTCPEVQADR